MQATDDLPGTVSQIVSKDREAIGSQFVEARPVAKPALQFSPAKLICWCSLTKNDEFLKK